MVNLLIRLAISLRIPVYTVASSTQYRGYTKILGIRVKYTPKVV